MQKLLYLIAFLVLGTTASAQDISGSWQGLISVGANQIRFVMNIKKTASGYESTFDSPDQKAFGIQGNNTHLIADSIMVDIQIMKASYRGKWDGKDSIAGIYQQAGFATILPMKRLFERDIPKAPASIVRSQTPKEPFGYIAEEVLYKNADQSIQYGATLTKPSQGSHFPTVILISGSGTQDRDGSMFGHKTYAVLAHLLTLQGIAVLRVDDRGIGKSTLGPNPLELTSVDFAADVTNSIHYLLSRPDIDKNKIGLIGHSEGGSIAPMVAVQNKSVAFIVLLAGPGQPGIDIWDFQMRRSFEKTNLTADHQKIADEIIHQMSVPFTKNTALNAIQSEMKSTYATWKKQYPDSLEKKLFVTPIEPAFLNMAKQFQSGLHWLNYFLNDQPAKNLQQLKIPVLALNGEYDIQVSCNENLSAIEKALKKAKNKQYQIKALPQLNHLFQTANTKVQTYDSIDESFSPVAAKLIGNWILQDALKK